MSINEATQTVEFDTAWARACNTVAALAYAKLPASLHSRIERATAIALQGGVILEEDGHSAMIKGSQADTWYACNGHCTCEDALYAPEALCKHLLAKKIYLRAGEVLREPVTRTITAPTPDTPPSAPHGIRAEHIATIQGKRYVKFAGLLERAHEEGLMELTATWTYNDENLSLATATATFNDGRRFTDGGDSTKENVSRQVAPHWRRMSLARAKARALRTALGVDLCALEELGDE